MRASAALLALLLLSGTAPPSGDVSMIAVEGEGAKYWPRWRGPSGQGLAAGSGYPDRWSATDHIMWKTPLESEKHPCGNS